MDYNPDNPLPIQEQRALEKYFNVEKESMATDGYLHSENAILRRNAAHFILKHSKSEKFDAFIPYLAMNYFDRYISRHQLPKVETCVHDDVVLLAIGCLSLAWKMRKKSFSITQFLEERKLNIDRLNILRMELMILNGLNWRMRAITAICFVGFFFNLILAKQGFKRRTINEIIIQAQGDITFTQFRPSVIAASALLVASSFLYPDELSSYKARIAEDGHVQVEDVMTCLALMTAMCKKNNMVMETAKLESREGSRLRVQAGEPSGSSQPSRPATNEPPMDEPSGSSKPSQPAPNEPPMDEPSGSSSSTPHREGKAPMVETSIPGREGKAPIDDTSEIQEEPESEQGLQMNFELKWVTNEEDLTIDSSRFRPVVSAEPRDVDTERDVATTGCAHPLQCCSRRHCCSLQ